MTEFLAYFDSMYYYHYYFSVDCPFLVHVKLSPTEGLYRDIEWPFHIKFAMAEHPFSCPLAWCHKKIWHPNINLAGTGAHIFPAAGNLRC